MGSAGWLPRVPSLTNCWTRAGHLTHAVSLGFLTVNCHLPRSVMKFPWDNTNFTLKTVRCHTAVKHSSGTAGDDAHESLSARVRVCNCVHSCDAATEPRPHEYSRRPAAERARGAGPCLAGSHAAFTRL